VRLKLRDGRVTPPLVAKLQPHKGASETSNTPSVSHWSHFNPTRVRLKHQRGGEPVGVSYNFNPTRVRLKPLRAVFE